MSQTILLPLDLNQEGALDSVFAATRRVIEDGDKVVLLTVIPEIDVGNFPYLETRYVKQLAETARDKLEALAKERLDEDTAWETDVRVGTVARTIVQRAEHFDADMIVMASHDPAFWDVLLGSVASQVVKHSHRSVLIVRQAKQPQTGPAAAERASRDPLAE